MASGQFTVQTKGIYHGLPVYPDNLKGLTAIITGANGISGYHMLKVLAQSPERWTKIYCLSRRPPAIPGGLPKNAEFVSLDFLKDPQEIAETLKAKNVKADYVFFFSYIQPPPKEGGGIWSDADELVRVNKNLLSNFLDALPLANVTPKRVMLQTGAKYYAIHLGPSKVPQVETDPRVTLEPNFYYPQEDYLLEWCKKHDAKYSTAMPCGILGAVPDAAMNLCFPLAVYATVQAHLKKPLEYPGSLQSFQIPQDQSSAMLNGYLEEWSVLRDQDVVGERYNATDGSNFTWEGFWPRLAAWYGLDWKRPRTEGLNEIKTPYNPPPRGYGPPATMGFTFTFTQWAKQKEVQDAWKEIAQKHDLMEKELRDVDRIFGFLDGMMLQTYPLYFKYVPFLFSNFLSFPFYHYMTGGGLNCYHHHHLS